MYLHQEFSLYFHLALILLSSFLFFFLILNNHIDGVMVSVLASSAIGRGCEPRSGQTIDLVFIASPLSIKDKKRRLFGLESG